MPVMSYFDDTAKTAVLPFLRTGGEVGMTDADKTIDGFAFWIENEENGVCYVPLNLCEKVLKLLKEQQNEIHNLNSMLEGITFLKDNGLG